VTAPLGCYAGAPLADRLHVRIRRRSFPLDAVVAAVPSGRVLEIGCGHGLVSMTLAADPTREVTGIDVDERKLEVARHAATTCGRAVTFATGDAGEPPSGPWDAVVVVDVLYLVPPAAQRATLARLADTLAPGGTLVVKEMATTPRWKRRWNHAQETLAVRVLRFTSGSVIAPTPTETMATWLTDLGLSVTHTPLDRGYLHPHAMLVARR
jgi:2-polyprenyl-3-methyl-5-hydroxy-6-metoxy-1,4-benzoquinol methylase